jgi:hypothetical protein
MADTPNEYTDAWKEGEEGHPVENAVAAAKKKTDVSEKDEYITAFTEDDKKEQAAAAAEAIREAAKKGEAK